MPLAEKATINTRREHCLATAFPLNRSGFPSFLNCLGLHQESVEVGVQAGVHASSFLQGWKGSRLRLVDTWTPPGHASESQMLYVDIANVRGGSAGKQHRAQCEVRLAEELRTGRAEIVNLDSTVAAARIPDGELDFVYLDARHDFAGVVADIHAWWPKVKTGGIFAGHDFVDGEFPEGDFFWISALHAVLPGLEGHAHVTREKDRYPSFFVLKNEALADVAPQALPAETMARKLYRERSKYFKLWRSGAPDSSTRVTDFAALCRGTCGQDCGKRAQEYTPTRTAVSTLRPFACGHAGQTAGGNMGDQPQTGLSARTPSVSDACSAEMVVDAHAYLHICLERCNVTCEQRGELFSRFGEEILSI